MNKQINKPSAKPEHFHPISPRGDSLQTESSRSPPGNSPEDLQKLSANGKPLPSGN